MTTPQVTIKYRTEHGVQPTDIVIDVSTPLTSEQLPTLEAENYKFLGWVHINSNGHESELSERMIVSENWLIPNGLNNQYYVVFTAKWKNDKKSEDTPVEPVTDESVKYTKQTLDDSQKQQARENIGVYSKDEVNALIPEIPEIPDIPEPVDTIIPESVTSGNFLVGNGTEDMVEKTPSEVLELIGAAPSDHSHDYGVVHIIESGTSGIWTYYKYSDGTAECWGDYTESSVSTTTAFGNIYRSTKTYRQNFPFTFTEVPRCLCDISSSGDWALWKITHYKASTTQTPALYVGRAASNTGIPVTFTYYAKGKITQ